MTKLSLTDKRDEIRRPVDERVESIFVADEPDVLGAVGAKYGTAKPTDDHAQSEKTLEERARLWDMAAPLVEPLLAKFGSIDNVAAMANQHASEIQKLREERDVAAIADKLRQQVAEGQLSPEAFDEKLRYEVLANRIFQNEIGNAFSAAREQYPQMDEELVRHVARSPQAVVTLAEHTHKRTAKVIEHTKRNAVAEYLASKGTPPPKPETTQGASPVTAGASYKPRGNFSRWMGGRELV